MTDPLERPNLEKIKGYIPGKPIEETQKELGVSSVIKLASNENPFGPSPKALKVLQEKAKEVNLYPDSRHRLLKNALTKKWGLEESNFVVGNGSDEIMQLACTAFLSAGEEVIISKHTFSIYEFVATIFDGKIKLVDLKNYTYDLAGMAKALSPKTKLVFLCNPNNPTGTYFNQKALDNFLAKVPKGCIVVIDEAYSDYYEAADFPNSLQYVKEGKNVIVLKTFSKFYGLAGLRVGYGMAKPELAKYLDKVRLPFNVNRLAMQAAAAALDDEEFTTKSFKNNVEGKKYLYQEFKKLGIKCQPTEANFIFFETDQPADEIFMLLLREGIIIRPLTSFGFPKAVRVTVGTMEQNQKFIAALKKVLQK